MTKSTKIFLNGCKMSPVWGIKNNSDFSRRWWVILCSGYITNPYCRYCNYCDGLGFVTTGILLIIVGVCFQKASVRSRLSENWISKSTVERRAGLGSTGMINASGSKHKAALVVRGVCGAFSQAWATLLSQTGKISPECFRADMKSFL